MRECTASGENEGNAAAAGSSCEHRLSCCFGECSGVRNFGSHYIVWEFFMLGSYGIMESSRGVQGLSSRGACYDPHR